MELQDSAILRTERGFQTAKQEYTGNRVTAWNLSRRIAKAHHTNSSAAVVMDYLGDHRVSGQVIYPAAGYSMAGLAIHQRLPGLDRQNSSLTLQNLRFRKALPLSNHNSISLQLCYEPAQHEFTVYSKNQTLPNSVTMHAVGKIGEIDSAFGQKGSKLNEVRSRCQEPLDVDVFYQRLRRSGLDYGPYFQRISSICLLREENEALTKLNAHPILSKTRDRWAQRITLLDAAFQSLGATLPIEDLGLFVPSHVQLLRVLNDFDCDLWCHVRLTKFSSRLVSGDMTLYSRDGRPLVEVIGLRCLNFPNRHTSGV